MPSPSRSARLSIAAGTPSPEGAGCQRPPRPTARRSMETVIPDLPSQRTPETQGLVDDLRRALRNNALEVHYQPVVDLAGEQVVAAEAFARWYRPGSGWIPPAEFVTAAEQHGFAADLDAWVLRTACAAAAQWRSPGDTPLPALSVNVSPQHLLGPGLAASVVDALRISELPAYRLTIELSAWARIDDVSAAALELSQLHALGVTLAIDDFGVGRSTADALRSLPVDVLKIDRSFTAGLVAGSTDYALVADFVDFATELGITTVAEGIERPEQRRAVTDLGVTYGQGFLWSRPMPDEAFRLAHERNALRAGRVASVTP